MQVTARIGAGTLTEPRVYITGAAPVEVVQ